MQELDDNGWLREYAKKNSEEAFAALVSRHINKVYSVALRHTRNPSEAEEITQAVFVILAKKARGLGKGVVLSGWLYQTARLVSVTYLRSEIRRARREQEAQTMQSILNEPDETWAQMAPLLDAAMASLNETDRHAVVLRFFDNKSMREVGAALGATEDAAKKRLGRALGKLQRFFARRGIHSTTAIIARAISSNSVQAAPATLAKSVTALAIAKGATASVSTLTLVKGALKVMAWSKTQTTIIAGVAVLLIGGGTILALKERARQEYQKDPVAYEIKHEPPVKDENELRDELVGAWQLVASKDWGAKQFINCPTNDYYRKIFDLTNETVLHYDSHSNLLFYASGPYSLNGSNYTESLQTATGGLARFRGTHPRFKIRVDGDMFYQEGFGKNPNIKEIWRRIQ